MQPSRLVAAVKFLSCQVFSPLSYQVSDKPTRLQPLPCESYRWGGCSMSLILSPSDAQSCSGPWLGPGAFLYFAFILPQMCPQTWCHKFLGFSHKFLGFSHLCVVLLLSQPILRACRSPSSSSIPLPHSPKPFSGFGEQTRPQVSPGSWEGGCVLCASQTLVSHWLFSKINPLNKKYYQQEHNQISERRSLEE